MPLANVYITGTKPSAYRSAILAGVRRAIVEGLVAPDERVVVRVSESEPDCVDVPTCRSDRFTLVDVLLYSGRPDDTKREFARMLRERLAQNPGIPPSDVAIALHEMSTVDLDVLPGEAGS